MPPSLDVSPADIFVLACAYPRQFCLEYPLDRGERHSSPADVEPDRARRLLVALVALHDLGKFAPGFQAKAPTYWPAALGACEPERIV
ncbi:MAG: HD domain-containing protein, partial [Gemmatimonadaceae bacterium]